MLNEDYEKEVLISENETKDTFEVKISRSPFNEYSSKVDGFVFVLICLFTLGLRIL